MDYERPWVECWNCGGVGMTPGCFEDCCSGASCDPDDAENCCCPSKCDVCAGKGGWEELPPRPKGPSIGDPQEPPDVP